MILTVSLTLRNAKHLPRGTGKWIRGFLATHRFCCRTANQKTTVKWGKKPPRKKRDRFRIGTAGKQSRKWQD